MVLLNSAPDSVGTNTHSHSIVRVL